MKRPNSVAIVRIAMIAAVACRAISAVVVVVIAKLARTSAKVAVTLPVKMPAPNCRMPKPSSLRKLMTATKPALLR